MLELSPARLIAGGTYLDLKKKVCAHSLQPFIPSVRTATVCEVAQLVNVVLSM